MTSLGVIAFDSERFLEVCNVIFYEICRLLSQSSHLQIPEWWTALQHHWLHGGGWCHSFPLKCSSSALHFIYEFKYLWIGHKSGTEHVRVPGIEASLKNSPVLVHCMYNILPLTYPEGSYMLWAKQGQKIEHFLRENTITHILPWLTRMLPCPVRFQLCAAWGCIKSRATKWQNSILPFKSVYGLHLTSLYIYK